MNKPNIIFLMVDQLASQVLKLYGGDVIDTPHIDRFAAEGVTFDNMISTCPVCTPYRSMWMTGRHPQTTGHLVNFMITRHDEIGWGDVFDNAGYDTGYIGKWHLHRGSFPQIVGSDFVPEGRDRLGFKWWRGYNFHVDYFNGPVNLDDWRVERWEGYETDALNRYAFEYLDEIRDKGKPFCLMVNPHQPHSTCFDYAPQEYYDRLPEDLPLPPNWDNEDKEKDLNSFRDYLAMVLACDDMLGDLLDGIEERGLKDNTIFVFTSDHGTHLGSHQMDFWNKKMPWEENVKVPFVMRWPGVFEGGKRGDVLTAPVDLLPTFCGLCDVSIPKTVEGHDLSAAWKGEDGAFEQDAVFMMNFHAWYDYLVDGWEWRGVRTKTHTYAKFLDGREVLFDNINDPQQKKNLMRDAGERIAFSQKSLKGCGIQDEMREKLAEFQKVRGDELLPGSAYKCWYDGERRVIRNAYGPLVTP